MSTTAKTLFNTQYVPAATKSFYTAPSKTTTIIDKLTLANTDGANSHTVSVYLVPSGQSAGDPYLVVPSLSIAANGTEDLSIMQNQILSSGDAIAIVADTASVVVARGSGREVT